MAQQLGMSLGGLNYCLKALVSRGWVKMESFSRNPNKLKYAYLLTARGMRAKTKLTAHFLRRKMAQYEALKLEIEAMRHEMEQG